MERERRRLAAIVSVDVVGYSRLMGHDEAGTLAALRTHRSEFIDPAITEHGGRIVKTMGDGLLIEFPSVVDATRCAIAVQKGMAARNTAVPDDKRITFRVGINLGDIIIEDDDIYGDGVNIAARLQELAEPGGIAISRRVHEDVQDRFDVEFEDTGEQSLKNIARPVQVWRWSPTAVTAFSMPQAQTRTGLPLPDKPSIAVLPFNNMSGDPEQEYFADGMTEDLITDLSKVSGLFVVSRNSSFTFKGRSVEMRDVARHLGVRYVVEGSVRKAGSRVRINVQLIDAVNDRHLWAERYDGTIENVFELQDDVGAKVVSALSVHLSGDEDERLQRVHTHNLNAYELYVRAKATPYPPVPDRIEAAREMFEQVIEMDPEFAGGYAGVSWMLSWSGMFGHFDLAEPAERALALARKAVEIDDSFGWSHVALGLALLLKKRHEEAVAAVDIAVARQPSDADAHASRGLILAFSGHPEEGIEPVERAIRLNPQFVNGPYLNIRSVIMAMAQDFTGSVQSFEENIARHGPVGPPVLALAQTAYWALGRTDDATRMAVQLANRFPAFRLTNWNFLELVRLPEQRSRLHDLMRNAGLPD